MRNEARTGSRPLERGLRLKKVTVLDGHYASGDHECFCFDKLDGPFAYEGTTEERIAAQDANRVYPHSLLPRGANYGRWRITVEFESLSSEDTTRPTPECARCHGTGIIGNGSVSECQDCDGQGQPATRPTGERRDESGYPSIAGIEAIVAERDAAAVIVNMVRSWFADQPPDQPGCECEACKLIRAVAVYDQKKEAPAARPTGDKE